MKAVVVATGLSVAGIAVGTVFAAGAAMDFWTAATRREWR